MIKKACIKVFFFALVLSVLWGAIYLYSTGGPRFFFNYHRIEPGDSKHSVIEMLGQPDEQNTIFRLGQQKGYESEYEKSNASGSKYYLFWNKGIDVIYSVGFDGNDRVTFKAYGGT